MLTKLEFCILWVGKNVEIYDEIAQLVSSNDLTSLLGLLSENVDE